VTGVLTRNDTPILLVVQFRGTKGSSPTIAPFSAPLGHTKANIEHGTGAVFSSWGIEGGLMKLRVQHRDGRIETITLHGRWSIIEGELLNRIVDENGSEHFFTHDGHYDGWGGRVQQA